MGAGWKVLSMRTSFALKLRTPPPLPSSGTMLQDGPCVLDLVRLSRGCHVRAASVHVQPATPRNLSLKGYQLPVKSSTLAEDPIPGEAGFFWWHPLRTPVSLAFFRVHHHQIAGAQAPAMERVAELQQRLLGSSCSFLAEIWD